MAIVVSGITRSFSLLLNHLDIYVVMFMLGIIHQHIRGCEHGCAHASLFCMSRWWIHNYSWQIHTHSAWPRIPCEINDKIWQNFYLSKNLSIHPLNDKMNDMNDVCMDGWMDWFFLPAVFRFPPGDRCKFLTQHDTVPNHHHRRRRILQNCANAWIQTHHSHSHFVIYIWSKNADKIIIVIIINFNRYNSYI